MLNGMCHESFKTDTYLPTYLDGDDESYLNPSLPT